MIYFGTENKPDDESYYAEAINARIVEGTKIIVSGMVSCQIKAKNLRNFLEEYGLNWQKYILSYSPTYLGKPKTPLFKDWQPQGSMI